MTTAAVPCSVLLLAGGQGRRMGGQDKGLLTWQGQPLIAHVHAVVRPLSDDLIISCNRNQSAYRPFADQLVGDAEPGFPGPLAGVLAGLEVARHDWLLVLACDAPRVDRALLDGLLALAVAQGSRWVRQGAHWQPMFSLIPCALRGALQQAWQAGERSLLRALLVQPLVALECAEDDQRLSNFNTPERLAD
ncbi:molybdenum cofactor guanylyltransferase MobA [Pseudomonas sp. MAFF212428]|uniref:Molybdenum cofactor guanylyltransferase n=1 Tax=Pseudomonas brassicae TaxID=2708063 RepID=A0A6M0CP02_9PSED|nr:molybdenum cofactor guanylyltransferase MobA [Pseudomonas brassicae]